MPPATDKETTCGLSQGPGRRHEPGAVSAVAPDPFRGWGRYRSAHIRAQKEPVVSPAGTGIEHRRPRRVSWCLACKAPGDPSDRTQKSLINRLRLRNRAENTFIPPGDTNRWRGTCLCRRRRHARDTPPLAGQCLTTAGNRGMGRTCLTSGSLAGSAPLAGGRALATGRFNRHGALAVGVAAT